MHKHYECNRLGDNCIFCCAPVIGTNLCKWCETIFNCIKTSDNSLPIGNDGTLVYDALNKRFIFV
jgi:hypothetical protein